MLHELYDHMFRLPLPLIEKLLRPVIIYLVLVVLLRLFGKRELAQLNPFDLVVLLSLSNTVQNAIIGDDNSITGGVIGAFGLLAINWLVVRTLYSSPRFTRLMEGGATVLVRNGRIDQTRPQARIPHPRGTHGGHPPPGIRFAEQECAFANWSPTARSTSREWNLPDRTTSLRAAHPL